MAFFIPLSVSFARKISILIKWQKHFSPPYRIRPKIMSFLSLRCQKKNIYDETKKLNNKKTKIHSQQIVKIFENCYEKPFVCIVLTSAQVATTQLVGCRRWNYTFCLWFWIKLQTWRIQKKWRRKEKKKNPSREDNMASFRSDTKSEQQSKLPFSANTGRYGKVCRKCWSWSTHLQALSRKTLRSKHVHTSTFSLQPKKSSHFHPVHRARPPSLPANVTFQMFTFSSVHNRLSQRFVFNRTGHFEIFGNRFVLHIVLRYY